MQATPGAQLLEEMQRSTGIVLDAWQREVVLDESPQVILKCGRKCGKTLALAFKIAYDALSKNFGKSDGILILSRGQRQSKEVFLVVRHVLASMGVVWARDPEEGQGYATMTMLQLPGGNKVYSLPSGLDGVTLRTYSFYKIFMDEAAFIPDAVLTATTACLAVYGKQLVKASTPFGTGGHFYDSWHSEEWKRYERKTWECPRVGLAFLRREKSRMTKNEYAQEYGAEFLEESEGAYPFALIAASTAKQPIDWAQLRREAKAVFFGVDFARFGEDENAIAECIVAGQAYVRVHIMHSRFRTTQIVGKILSLIKENPKFTRVITDEGGVGGGPTDQLIELLGRKKVLGVANQRRDKSRDAEGRRGRLMKADLHSNLIRLLENGRIVLDDDIKIIRSLRSMKYRYTMAGDLTLHGRDSHAAEAIVRAVLPLRDRSYKKSVSVAFVPHSHAVGALSEIEDMDKSWVVTESPSR